jgi:hypothetical protein
VSVSDRSLPSFRLSVRLSVIFNIFDFFSRTTWPILTRLGTNRPWAGREDSSYSKEERELKEIISYSGLEINI